MEPMTLAELAGDLPRPGVLCTLAKVVGSAPQAPGAKMYVWRDGFKGTIGGGRFEAEVLAESRKLLDSHRPEAILKEYTLCREMGQCSAATATAMALGFFDGIFFPIGQRIFSSHKVRCGVGSRERNTRALCIDPMSPRYPSGLPRSASTIIKSSS